MKTTSLACAIIIASVALASCAPIALPDNQKQPDSVQPGMTSRQVEKLMGAPSRTCWVWVRGEGREEDVCFVEGVVQSFGTKTQKPDTREISFNAVFTTTRPPKGQPPPSATEVAIGMTPDSVSRLKGKPFGVIERYNKGQMEYRATFVGDVLKSFEDVPLPPVP